MTVFGLMMEKKICKQWFQKGKQDYFCFTQLMRRKRRNNDINNFQWLSKSSKLNRTRHGVVGTPNLILSTKDGELSIQRISRRKLTRDVIFWDLGLGKSPWTSAHPESSSLFICLKFHHSKNGVRSCLPYRCGRCCDQGKIRLRFSVSQSFIWTRGLCLLSLYLVYIFYSS